MKWTMFISFLVLLIGGLNYLLMGILKFDMFGEIFGYDSVAGRVIYSILGIAATILTATVISKTYYSTKDKKQVTATATAPRSTTKKTV